MREGEVDAAAVDVDGFAEQGFGHRRALDMPAGTAPTPGRLPARLRVGGGLPEHEVAGIFLVRSDFDTRTGEHLAQVALGQLAVAGIALDVEQHVIFCGIGVVTCDQPLDHRDDLRQVRRDARLVVDLRDTERFEVLVISLRIARRNDADLHAFLYGGSVDLVVDVGDVAGVLHARVLASQQPREHVEHHGGAGVADVGVGINRRAADVHRDPVRILRDEFFLVAGQRVVQLHIR